MLLPTIVIFGVMILMSVSALVALFLAAQDGQFMDMEKGAESIFDKDEPIGKCTDAFPGTATVSSTTPFTNNGK